MDFYNNFIRLCNSIGKSPTSVLIEIGLSKSLLTRWKDGRGITNTSVLKIADYFGVSPEELLRKNDTASAKVPTTTLDDFTYAMRNHSGNLTATDKAMLLSLAEKLATANKEREKEKNGEAG